MTGAAQAVRYALHVPNLAEPAHLVDIGVRAEEAGWDGLLLWDHVFGGPAFRVPVSDPWVVLGALAVRTSRVRLGTAVTPLARRRPQKLARETVTVDLLSNGRVILGVGLGDPPEEYTAFGESAGHSTLAARLDEALDVVTGLWTAEPFDHAGQHFTVRGAQFLPAPAQRPRPPIWVACTAPHTAPLRRAARWDGVILTGTVTDRGVAPGPPRDLETAVQKIATYRGGTDDYDVVVLHPGPPSSDYVSVAHELGATWILVAAWIDGIDELASRSPR